MALFGSGPRKRISVFGSPDHNDAGFEIDQPSPFAGLARNQGAPGYGSSAGTATVMPAQPQAADMGLGSLMRASPRMAASPSQMLVPQQNPNADMNQKTRPETPLGIAQRAIQQQQQTGVGPIDPTLAAMVGNAPERAKSYWKGGDKFRFKDGLAAALAVLGDFGTVGDTWSGTRGRSSGGGYSAVNNLVGGRASGLKQYQDDAQEYATNRRMAAMPNMTPRELAAYMVDPKSWASNMSRAATSRYDAATLNPGDTRYLGDGAGTFQAPTRGQQYADSLGLEAGTDAYNNALRDQELGANGPTAFGNQQQMAAARYADQRNMELMRQQGRMGLEGLRQGNRMETRAAPTYRDMNPPAPRAAAPRQRGQSGGRQVIGPNGQMMSIFPKNGRWVDAQGRPI